MTDLFSDDIRRNPYPLYDQLRTTSPVLRVPPPFDAWMIFEYDSVNWALNDHETFSSRVPAPQWFIFFDPPAHTKLRALISRAFTPRMVANLEPRIRELSRHLLDRTAGHGEMDLATDFSVPLAMQVIAGMIGIPIADWPLYKQWSDIIMRLSYSRSGGEEAERSRRDFTAVTAEIDAYLGDMIQQRRKTPQDDLLTRLIEAEVDGERLSQQEILGFFQLLVVAGQETTANLINNAMLCLIEHPRELARLRVEPALLPSAIEEVLRYRSPLQWIMRTPRRDVELRGQAIPAGKLVLPVIGSANRDPRQFPEAGRFDIGRDPNPHLAFGHGIHFCLGAALSRMEAKVALSDLLERFRNIQLADGSWEPRQALNVLGPA
ncbi:MAG TPA: cytochrome P450, partial [Bryobacteraceae bacterium]|nr:cytochrome P450 [Bryobacteraceae bacterium]